MRKFVYFIERKDTNEWFYQEIGTQNPTGLVHGEEMTFAPSWTNDPFTAINYSKHGAEMEIKMGTFLGMDIDISNLIVTEHEFVINPINP